jgi:hypothetical protein
MSKSSTESRRSDTAATDTGNEPWAVSEADIAAWAERERKRRQAWLEGPNEDDKQAWADAERQRRKRQYRDELLDIDLFDIDLEDGRRFADRMMAGFTNRMVDTHPFASWATCFARDGVSSLVEASLSAGVAGCTLTRLSKRAASSLQ